MGGVLAFLAAFVLGWFLIIYLICQAWQKHKAGKKRAELCSLPRHRVYGRVTVKQYLKSRKSISSPSGYSYGSNGTYYQHYSYDSYEVTTGYILTLYPDDNLFSAGITLYSLPGKMDWEERFIGLGWVEYVTDDDGKNYFIRLTD